MKLEGKTAVVTGASSGLGAALAQALAAKGAKVFGIGRNTEKLYATAAGIGENFQPVQLDVSNEEAVKGWIESTFSENLLPDILVNNAGAGHFGKIDELPATRWQEMINTNLNAVFYLTSNLVRLMKRNDSVRHIINIGSVLGKTSGAEKSGYSATKYAMQGFSEALFKELRGDNIKVTLINPGSIDTHFFKTTGIVPNESMLQPTDLANVIVNVLETPDNVLIDELTVRPLKPKR